MLLYTFNASKLSIKIKIAIGKITYFLGFSQKKTKNKRVFC